jgi:adenylyltransferase/sulfurtransferase
VPDCATTGVLGVLPGTVGCVQATEAVKLVLGLGEPLAGRLLFYDATDMTFDSVEYLENPDCPVCSGALTSVGDVTYEGGCTVDGAAD